MGYKPHIQNAVAAIRVSTTKQGTQGDSPEAQKEQIERFAQIRGIKIKKLFLFLESASKVWNKSLSPSHFQENIGIIALTGDFFVGSPSTRPSELLRKGFVVCFRIYASFGDFRRQRPTPGRSGTAPSAKFGAVYR
jgi:hypothetical protein